jgi:RNA polymerase sigma-32 factor
MAHLDTQETVQSTRRFIKKAMQLPLLELEHEQILARKWAETQDEKALHDTCVWWWRWPASSAITACQWPT